MKPAIAIENLGKRFKLSSDREGSLRSHLQNLVRLKFAHKRPFWALREVSLTVTEGEVFGIIGPNGSGKSTLLKILSKIMLPTEGRVVLRGKVNSLLEVGTGFHAELSGRENIFLNGSILGLHRQEIKTKFDEIVAFAEVEGFLDVPVKHYSSGMYVRLAFAVAAHLDPDILIVDEVLSVGDAAFQQKCINKMEEEVLQGRTVVLVSHQLDVVRRLCQRVLWLQEGRQRMLGLVEDVTRAYIDHFRYPQHSDYHLESREYHTKVQLLSVSIIDGELAGQNVVRSGARTVFRLAYESSLEQTSIEVRLQIRTLAYLPILELRSTCQHQHWLVPGSGALTCKVENLDLRHGSYRVAVEIHRGEMVDVVPDAMILEVKSSALCADERPTQFPVLTAQEWSVDH